MLARPPYTRINNSDCNRIKRLMASDAKYTQEGIAEITGIPRSSVAKYIKVIQRKITIEEYLAERAKDDRRRLRPTPAPTADIAPQPEPEPRSRISSIDNFAAAIRLLCEECAIDPDEVAAKLSPSFGLRVA